MTASQRLAGSWSDLVAAMRLFAALLAIMIVASAALTWGKTPVPHTDVATTAAVACVVLAFAIHGREALAPVLRRGGFDRGGWWKALFAWAALVAFAEVYFGIGGWLGIPTVKYVTPFAAQGWPLWSVFVLTSVAPAISEEIAFRGYVMQQLDRSIGSREALFIQAALFSVLHLAPVIFVSHFAMGLAFGVLRRHTRSLYPGMLVHAAYNATVILRELASG